MGIKITAGMVDAGVDALTRLAEDEAMKNAQPLPDWDALEPEQWDLAKQMVHAVIKAAADHMMEHGNRD